MQVTEAIMSPRLLHQLCHVAMSTAAAGDLDSGRCSGLLCTLLSAGAPP